MLIHYTTVQEDHTPDPPTMAHLVLGVNYALLALASLMVGCRILVKGRLGKLALEDALIVFSTLVIWALVVVTQFAVRTGLGRHLADIEPQWWPTYTKYAYVHMTLGCVPYPLTKVSMLCFYLRLAPHPTFRKLCHATIAWILLTATVMALLGLFGCTPISGGWDHSPELGATCIDIQPYLYFYTSMSIATDIMLMVLPIPILLRLQLRPKTKYGLVAMFAVGIAITAVSAYSVYMMWVAFHSPDFAWAGAKSWLWALAEFNAGIIVACMPSMLLFWKWVTGDMDRRKPAGPRRSPGGNGTFGSGGRKLRERNVSSTLEGSGSGSTECIVREGGEAKCQEVVVVEMTSVGGGK